MKKKEKLNLGSGNEIKEDFINVDFKQDINVDVVHNLNNFPWPFENNTFSEVLAENVIEHLDDFMKVMEEIYRVTKQDSLIKISVPYWNSSYAYIDPTHKKGFHELTFSFFDPESPYCKQRPYYSKARFKVKSFSYVIAPFAPYFLLPFVKNIEIKNKILKKIIGLVGNIFSNIILELRVELQKIS
ncbi:class I SAM-dependent methyltransferase [Candidatus Pelagibacter sp.]|uniref:class I SAM-dependent methyltransferase n=1 Tax=Candidatus Pelagibacter sp. TaxID=2024849 RepID=UPI003F838688